MPQRAVQPTAEFRRVAELPRRDWTDAEAAELAALMTREFRTPFGKYDLKPIQGVMIAEAADAGGLFAACGVGSGKTIPSFIIPTVLGAKRPLLFVKANLYEKTVRDLAFWSYHFRVHPRIEIMTYERLSVDYGGLLADYNPDLILGDEGQALKNRYSARGRKFLRFMKDHPDTRFVYLGGSPLRKSLKELWHLMCLALPDSSPLPYILEQIEEWADALDPDIDENVRLAPGCLFEFVAEQDCAANDDGHTDKLAPYWRGLRRRITSTRGVVATAENDPGMDLLISERKVKVPEPIERALDDLRTTWETPNGDELTEAVEVWRHARELACGFFYRWVPRPPEEWMAARKAWNKFVRTILGHQREGLDSPKQVAVRYSEHALYRLWSKVKPLYDPRRHQVAEWIDDYLLRDAAAWLHKGPGIAWVEHNAVGQRLAVLTGLPYYGGGEEASRRILDAKGPIIASIAAHGTGKNLQAYDRNLILSCPPSADMVEQLLGRTHRTGQTADEVTAEIYRHVPEIVAGYERLITQAHFIQESTGMTQKILKATKTFGPAVV